MATSIGTRNLNPSFQEKEMAQVFIRNHPYWPQDAPIPQYRPNVTPVPVLLGSFGAILTIVLISSIVLARRSNRNLTASDDATICWFVLCGFLHCFFEGYFVLNHEDIAASQDLFAQLWKEYALSDSRYLTSDPFMLSVESMTVALWGPLCFIVAVCIVQGNNFQYLLQIVACVAHLYGVGLYYATCYSEQLFHGVSHSRPEFLYFWVYYVGFNLPWVVVPTVLLYNNMKTIIRVCSAFEKLNGTLQAAKIRTRAQELKKRN